MSEHEEISDVEEVEEVLPPVTNRQMSSDEVKRLAQERAKIRQQSKAYSQPVDEDGVPLDVKKAEEYLEQPIKEQKDVELAERLLKRKREEDLGIDGDSDGEDIGELLDMFGIEVEEISTKMNMNQRQQLLVENMDSEQLSRYEYFRRTNLNTGGIKKLVNSAIGYNVGTDFAKILAGVGKVFVGEVVEKAKEVQRRQNEARVLEQLQHKRELKAYEDELEKLDYSEIPNVPDLGKDRTTYDNYRIKIPDDEDQLTPDHIQEAWRLLMAENHTILEPRQESSSLVWVKTSKNSLFKVRDIGHSVPTNNDDTDNTTDSREHQSDNTSGSETSRKSFFLDVLTSKVEEVLVVTSSITNVAHVDVFTDLLPVISQGLVGLDSKRILNEHHGKTLDQVPFNMAMEEPDTWVVSLESDHKVGLRLHVQDVSLHWIFRNIVRSRLVVTDWRSFVAVVWTSFNDLEHVTVQVERMLTCILVVEDNFHDFVFLQDNRVGVGSVNSSIRSIFTSRHDGSKSRNNWSNIGNSREEGIVNTVSKVVHDNVQSDLIIIAVVSFFLIQRNKVEVVKVSSVIIVNGVLVCEGVVLHVKVLRNETTNVNQTHQIGCIWFDVPSVVSGVVHQQVLRNWLSTSWVVHIQKAGSQSINVIMVPFSQGNDNFLIPFVWRIRVLNHKSTSHTVHILTRSMGVVPERTDLIRNSKVVQHGVTRSNRTLSEQRRTVHLGAVFLEQTVEMQCGISIRESVRQVQLDTITLVDPDVRPWEFTVTRNNWSFISSVGICIDPTGSPVENMGFCQSSSCKKS
ncbi:hypothetical protein OGAPHI_001642 [Ogataea philodendri]|uniref:TAFII28-like protein domain-containing protein n=1 Tax=Ogataea philodendri TaxID=1378263 RepID=A0A9P8T7P9_9ASCO|nr:uncharacterized protein OGAPHI_001642 [Ogataea philodendri]KAH3669046.1 hypothetical protein OGAPHI_001642 [Ogataea philodendri]